MSQLPVQLLGRETALERGLTVPTEKLSGAMLGLMNKSELGIKNPNERSDAQTKTGEAKTGESSKPLPSASLWTTPP